MIERSESYRRIKKIEPEWNLIISNRLHYLIAMIDDRDVGVMCFHPHEDYPSSAMMHVSFLPEFRGRAALRGYTDAFSWIFANTEYDRIVAEIPQEMRAAHFMARHAGATFDGVEEGFRKYSLLRQNFQIRRAA